jgi:hypothetical protein
MMAPEQPHGDEATLTHNVCITRQAYQRPVAHSCHVLLMRLERDLLVTKTSGTASDAKAQHEGEVIQLLAGFL